MSWNTNSFKKLFVFFLLLLKFNFSFANTTNTESMVVTDHHLASQIGIDILKSGGNAVDAAVAIAYALAVVQPCCGNIGGGGFLLLHTKDNHNIVINFREKAPLRATEQMYKTKYSKTKNTSVQVYSSDQKYSSVQKGSSEQTYSSVQGYSSVAVPGTVLGLETALNQYGTLPLHTLIKPAILLAEQGFKLQQGDIKLLSPFTNDFAQEKNVAAIFLKKNNPLKIGDMLIQKQLAESLKLIEKNGAKVFYQGEIANKIVKASEQNGGILTLKDFSEYTVQQLNPIECQYKDYKIISTPPPSSGGVALCEMLNILKNYPIEKWDYNNPKTKHVIIDAMRFAFLDRQKLGDPDFVENPTSCLLSNDYAYNLYKKISENKSTVINDIYLNEKHTNKEYMNKENINPEDMNQESTNKGCTTHFVVKDKWGNIVSLTYTLNSLFGAKVIASDTGFFLNNEMDDFSSHIDNQNQFGLIQGENNVIQPGKRPLSSMAPTLVFKNDKPFLVLGAAGGPKIITSNLLTILQVIDFKISLPEAVNAPRFHHQFLPNEIQYEENAFTPLVKNQLKKMGYFLKPIHGLTGVVEAMMINPATGELVGASDKRRSEGKVLSY